MVQAMSMSDPIADMLTRIRNANTVRHAEVDIPLSNLKREMCRVLKEEGYIADYAVEEEPIPGRIRVKLKYLDDRAPVVQGIKRVSKPSLRVYVRTKENLPVMSGLGISILSTSQGVMTGKQAWRKRIGGEVLCEVW